VQRVILLLQPCQILVIFTLLFPPLPNQLLNPSMAALILSPLQTRLGKTINLLLTRLPRSGKPPQIPVLRKRQYQTLVLREKPLQISVQRER
jgi:hypothetical protein